MHQAPQRPPLVQGDVIGLVAPDRILRILGAGMMNVALVGHIFLVYPHDTATHPAGFRIPADVISDLECPDHGKFTASLHPYNRKAWVWLHEVTDLAFRDYQRNGMLRPDLQPAGGPEDAQLAAYQYHQEFREQEMRIWQAFGTRKPSFGLYLDETPQIVVYERR